MIHRLFVVAVVAGVAHLPQAHADVIFVSLQNGTVQSFDVSLGTASAIAASAQTFTNQAIARPQGLAFDSSGNLFVASYDTSTVAKYASDGTYLPAGSISSNLQNPFGIAFDGAGNLFVVNGSGNSVSKFDAAGSYQGAITTNVSSPTGVAIDGTGNLYVANAGNNTIAKFDAAGNYQAAGSVAGNLVTPYGLAFDAFGNLYAANSGANTISQFSPSGSFVSTFAAGGPLNVPVGLAFDSLGNLYAANYFGDSISKFNAQGALLLSWSTAAAPRFLAFAPVPEPSAWALAASTLALVGLYPFRQRSLSIVASSRASDTPGLSSSSRSVPLKLST